MVVIVTLNIRGLKRPEKQKYLYNWLRQNDVDVAGIQEIDIHTMSILDEEYNVAINFTPLALGTALVFRKSLGPTKIEKDPNGRVVKATFKDFCATCVYGYPFNSFAPQTRKDLFERTLPIYLVNNGLPNFLIGDFNSVIDLQDRCASNELSIPLRSLVRNLNLVDAFRLLHPNAREFSFIGGNGKSRIDHIYVPKPSGNIVLECRHAFFAETDHAAVIARLDLELGARLPKRKSAFWRMNASSLQKQELVDVLSNFLDSCERKLTSENLPLIPWWEDVVKPGIRNITQSFDKREARKHSRYVEILHRQYDRVKREFSEGNEARKADFFELRSELSHKAMERFQSIKVFGGSSFAVADEPAGLYHIAQASKNLSSGLSCLKDSDGTMQTEPDRVVEIIERHFSSLYGHTDECLPADPFLEAVQEKLSEEEVKRLQAPLSTSEIWEAVDSVEDGKASGLDGIPAEFYKKLWQKIKFPLQAVLNELREADSLPRSMREGSITLIPKSGDQTSITNWRPITLLCSDYKIYAKCLAQRLKPVMKRVINENQTGGMSGRTIYDNLAMCRNVVLDSCVDGKAKRETAILAVDFEKAFDRVNRAYLYAVMGRLGFPSTYVKAIRSLYEGAISKVALNGRHTGDIALRSGVKQGCPLSPYLFILYVEPLMLQLQNHLDGVRIGEARLKVSGFIDDISVFVSGDTDLREANRLFTEFESVSNAKINRTKTAILGLGKWRGRTRWPIEWLVPTSQVKILGASFSDTIDDTIRKNEEDVLQRVRGILAMARSRQLTIHQRVYFVNTHVVSKVVHLLTTLPVRRVVFWKCQSLIYHFVWAHRLEKASMAESFLPLKAGGLGLVCLKAKAKALLAVNLVRELLGDSLNSKLTQYWSASKLRFIAPLRPGPHRETTPPIFDAAIEAVAEIEAVEKRVWESVTAKVAYLSIVRRFQADTLTVQARNPARDYSRIWGNISVTFLNPIARAHIYYRAHDRLPTRQRLWRIHRLALGSQLCSICRLPETAEHIESCVGSRPVVNWFLRKLRDIQPMLTASVSRERLFSMDFQWTDGRERTTVLWLIAEFTAALWESRLEKAGTVPPIAWVVTKLKGAVALLKRGSLYRNKFAPIPDWGAEIVAPPSLHIPQPEPALLVGAQATQGEVGEPSSSASASRLSMDAAEIDGGTGAGTPVMSPGKGNPGSARIVQPNQAGTDYG